MTAFNKILTTVIIGGISLGLIMSLNVGAAPIDWSIIQNGSTVTGGEILSTTGHLPIIKKGLRKTNEVLCYDFSIPELQSPEKDFTEQTIFSVVFIDFSHCINRFEIATMVNEIGANATRSALKTKTISYILEKRSEYEIAALAIKEKINTQDAWGSITESLFTISDSDLN